MQVVLRNFLLVLLLITVEATRAASSTTVEHHAWSQANVYNGLGQLDETAFGELHSGIIQPGDVIRLDTWAIDPVGNWNGHPAASGSAPGRTTVLANGPTRTAAAATDSRNRVLWQQEQENGTPTHTASLTYDPAGNLKSGGKYFYQYNA